MDKLQLKKDIIMILEGACEKNLSDNAVLTNEIIEVKPKLENATPYLRKYYDRLLNQNEDKKCIICEKNEGKNGIICLECIDKLSPMVGYTGYQKERELNIFAKELAVEKTEHEQIFSENTNINGGYQKMRKGNSSLFLIFSVLCFILSAILMYEGYDKITNYKNSDSYYSTNVNAYVGGDAYNYIINGNYATGFFVLSIGFLIAGVLLIIARNVINAIYDTQFMPEYERYNGEPLPPR